MSSALKRAFGQSKPKDGTKRSLKPGYFGQGEDPILREDVGQANGMIVPAVGGRALTRSLSIAHRGTERQPTGAGRGFPPGDEHNSDRRGHTTTNQVDSNSNAAGGLTSASVAANNSPTRGAFERRALPEPPADSYDPDMLFQNLSNVQVGVMQLENERQILEEKVKKLQRSAFKRFDSPEWEPVTLEDIARQLETLEFDIKRWSKDYSSRTLPPSSLEYPDSLIGIVTQVSCLSIAEIIDRLPHDGTRLLVHGIITCIMYRKIFEDPFFGITDRCALPYEDDPAASSQTTDKDLLNLRSAPEPSESQFGEMLSHLYEHFRDCSLTDAANWRVQTLRLFNPPSQTERLTGREERRRKFRDLNTLERQQAVHRLCKESIDLVDPFIQPTVAYSGNNKMHNDLIAIFQKAADLSLSIWVQKQELETETMVEQSFNHGNNQMEAHQLHRATLDLNPTALDKLPIILVTQPTVLLRVYKDGDGGNAISSYILKKAICFMGARLKPIGAQSSTGSMSFAARTS